MPMIERNTLLDIFPYDQIFQFEAPATEYEPAASIWRFFFAVLFIIIVAYVVFEIYVCCCGSSEEETVEQSTRGITVKPASNAAQMCPQRPYYPPYPVFMTEEQSAINHGRIPTTHFAGNPYYGYNPNMCPHYNQQQATPITPHNKEENTAMKDSHNTIVNVKLKAKKTDDINGESEKSEKTINSIKKGSKKTKKTSPPNPPTNINALKNKDRGCFGTKSCFTGKKKIQT
uniref:Uncharacterized protein n=1 Tax=Rhabditophanes sp. KR3021 TaxID=114890 RepID=A0AC35TIT4_9BILA